MIVLLRFSHNRIEEMIVGIAFRTLEVVEEKGIFYEVWTTMGLPQSVVDSKKVKFLLQKHKVDGLPYYVRAA